MIPFRLKIGNSLKPYLTSWSVTLLSNQASAIGLPVIHAETAAVGWTIAVAEWLTAAIPADPGLRDLSPESTQAFDQVAPEPPAAACAGHAENMAAFNGA